MVRKIVLELPDEKIKTTATLLNNEFPEICNLAWEELKTLLKGWCNHTASTESLC